MAPVIHLDTHIVMWLYGGETGRLSRLAAKSIESHALVISPMVEFELQYLFEVRKARVRGSVVIDALMRRIGLAVDDVSFAAVLGKAGDFSWTQDPFDRVIVAQAALRKVPLLTKDEVIHKHYDRAVW